MIRSMTGFGSADGMVGSRRVTVEIRSVNHRFFTPSIKLPSAFASWEGEVREALRRHVGRGHVSLFARIDDAAARGGPVVDEARVAEYVSQLRGLQARFGLSEELGVDTILRLPDVLTTAPEEASGTAAELLAIVDQAGRALVAMRVAEGERLAGYLEERLQDIGAALDRIGERAPARIAEYRDRLRAHVRELADGIGVDEQRLAQEVAIQADRLDVDEELSRFRAHLAAFRDAIAAPQGEGVGKRLGFLLQEMVREANTTGSKGNDSAILRDVLLVKEELERIREQVENVE